MPDPNSTSSSTPFFDWRRDYSIFIFFAVVAWGVLAWRVDVEMDSTTTWTPCKVSFLLLSVLGFIAFIGALVWNYCPNLRFNLHYNSWLKKEEDSTLWMGVVVALSLFFFSALFFTLAQFDLYSMWFAPFEKNLYPVFWTCVAITFVLYLWLMSHDVRNKPMSSHDRKKYNRSITLSGILLGFFLVYTPCLWASFNAAHNTDPWAEFAYKEPHQENGFVRIDHMRDGDHLWMDYGVNSLEEVPAELATLKPDMPDFSDRVQKIMDRRSNRFWYGYPMKIIDPIHRVWRTEVDLGKDSCLLAVHHITSGYEVKSINGHTGALDFWCSNLVENKFIIQSIPDYFE